MAPAAPSSPPSLECNLPSERGAHVSTNGVVDLRWASVPPAPRYQLEELSPSSQGEFRLRYDGPDQSSVRSGLAEGMHRFRVRAIRGDGSPGQWSAPLTIRIRYMEASRVRLLLILGGMVVVATVTAILHGHITHRRKEEKP